VSLAKVKVFEDILYSGENSELRLPMLDEVIALLMVD